MEEFILESINNGHCYMCMDICQKNCELYRGKYDHISYSIAYGFTNKYPTLYNIYNLYSSYIKKGYSVEVINEKMNYIKSMNLDEIYQKSLKTARQIFKGKRLEYEEKYLQHFYLTISEYYYSPVIKDGHIFCPYFEKMAQEYGKTVDGHIKRF